MPSRRWTPRWPALQDDALSPRIGALRATLQTAQRLVHDDVLALRELTGIQYAADSGAADPAAALGAIADDLREDGTPVEVVVGELPDAAGGAPGRADPGRPGGAAQRGQARPGRHTSMLCLGTEGNTVVVSVIDDGPGFDPGSAVGPVDGHIGLALLTDAAEGVGGRLDLRSRPGRGTTVRMSVPIPRTLVNGSSGGRATGSA